MKSDSLQRIFLRRHLILCSALAVFCLLSACANFPTIKSPKFFSTADKASESTPVAEEASEGFGLAIKAMQAGENELALALFNELQIKYPELSGPWLNTGIILMKQEKYEDALLVLEKAISVNLLNKYAYNQLGLCLRQLGRFEEAKNAYNVALSIDPNYALAHYNLGVLLELYFQDLNGAYEHFLSYQKLENDKDKTVANWIKDLRRRANIPEPVVAAPESAPGTSTQEASKSMDDTKTGQILVTEPELEDKPGTLVESPASEVHTELDNKQSTTEENKQQNEPKPLW